MRVKASRRHPDGVKAFVEQGVVRKELSDNLCFYNGEQAAIQQGRALLADLSLNRLDTQEGKLEGVAEAAGCYTRVLGSSAQERRGVA